MINISQFKIKSAIFTQMERDNEFIMKWVVQE